MKTGRIVQLIIITAVYAAVFSSCGGSSVTGGGESVMPAVPSKVTATQGTLEDSVMIQWDEVDDAEYYVIYKAIDTPESFKVIKTRVEGLTYSDTPVSSGRTFYYRVAAGNGNKWSGASVEVKGFALKGAPMPPETVSVTGNEIGRITLTWAAVINADSYNIYRCDVKYGTYEKINTADVTGTAFTDTNVTPDKKYYYKIVPVNEYGQGAFGSILSGTALQQVPVWPGSVIINASDHTFGEKVRIEWPAAEYAASYSVYRAPSDGQGGAGEYALIAENVTDVYYEDRDTELENKPNVYYYRIVAVSSGGQADSGSWDTGGVDRSIPALVNPPVTVTASKGKTNVITVTWSVSDGANGGYTVYRSTSSSFTSPVKVADRISALTFDDTTMAPVADKQTYYYKVTAWSVSGLNYMESGMSAVAVMGFANPDVPGVPVNIVSSMNYDNGSIIVSWTAADTWTKTYSVYRSDNGIDGDYNLVSENQAATGITETLAVDGGPIEAGVQYYYKVLAVNSIGSSALSSGTLAVFTLRIPTNLSVSSKYNWDISCTYTYTVTWAAVKGATGYEVGYYYDKTWHLITITSGSTTTVTFKSPNYGGGSYPVRIRSINSTPDPVIYSDYSAQVKP